MFRKLLIPIVVLLAGCAHRHAPPFAPARSFSTETLAADFELMRSALEDVHPGLYDFTSREQLQAVFDRMRAELTREMTEAEFLQVLAPLNGRI